jgi:hypothetical protein
MTFFKGDRSPPRHARFSGYNTSPERSELGSGLLCPSLVVICQQDVKGLFTLPENFSEFPARKCITKRKTRTNLQTFF